MTVTRWWLVALLGVVAAALWWLQSVAVDFGMFGGTFGFGLDIAASIAVAIFCVAAAAELATGIGYATFTDNEPTGFERASAYVALGALAVVLVLAHFGVNITTLLATSAVLTAVIGLALQPTLGALIAGFTLNADRLLKIGDGLNQNGETLTVTGLGWRSVSLSRVDGSKVVISNSRILDGSTTIIVAGSSVRAEMALQAPLSCEPHRIGELVATIVADIAVIDRARPVTASPISFDPERAQMHVRIRYWVTRQELRPAVEEEIATRLWYAFQREGILWPVSANFITEYAEQAPSLASPFWSARIATVLSGRAAEVDAGVLAGMRGDEIVRRGVLLLFADRERIVLPDRLAGAQLMLLDGHLVRAGSAAGTEQDQANGARRPRRLALHAMRDDLARKIGPMAGPLVSRAALNEPDLTKIRSEMASEIDDATQRRAFIAANIVSEPIPDAFAPGQLLPLRRDEFGMLETDPPLRAAGAVAVVCLPTVQQSSSGRRSDRTYRPSPTREAAMRSDDP